MGRGFISEQKQVLHMSAPSAQPRVYESERGADFSSKAQWRSVVVTTAWAINGETIGHKRREARNAQRPTCPPQTPSEGDGEEAQRDQRPDRRTAQCNNDERMPASEWAMRRQYGLSLLASPASSQHSIRLGTAATIAAAWQGTQYGVQ
jgi:hypothetical protein